MAPLEFESVEETQKLERDIGIANLMETGKIWGSVWSLSTKLHFELRFGLQIARQALEMRLLSELKERDGRFFTGPDATLDLKELTVKLLEERSGDKWKRGNVSIWRFWINRRLFQMIVKMDNFFCQ